MHISYMEQAPVDKRAATSAAEPTGESMTVPSSPKHPRETKARDWLEQVSKITTYNEEQVGH